MTLRMLRLPGTAAAVTAGALLGLLGVAPSATASAPVGEASFYTGAQQTGDETAVDLDAVGVCQSLPRSARSAVNLSAQNIDVFFRPGCETGTPAAPGDTYYVLGSLHTAGFPFPALSYRVQSAA
ncbi:hypothetical protein GCM10011583_24260 [Streptomyces camponoticapitis]|uniref:Secreted protein n=1 Tax=Streptomyces camponoticapitis TaxID=1616125 RepID=A0ABQ2E346_9ACTN|nr:hypothetical protein [Streptomyces camponoticapitis]GGJ91916.1 hypothetical protein GCM10011583_24260 [Streptomyces camponoticapitis]